jgi:hypothetical protein
VTLCAVHVIVVLLSPRYTMCRVIGVMSVLVAFALEASGNGAVARLCKHEQHRRTEMFSCVCSPPFIRPHTNFPLLYSYMGVLKLYFLSWPLLCSGRCYVFVSLYSAY